MGAIYRATDESLGRDVAVKLVRGCRADDPESFERLRREACAAGKLNHPRVAQMYALNFSNGHPYLVMELVTGQDFAQKMQSEGRIEEGVVLRMALDVAEGLSALNREGLVHGDIKPANIVMDRDGNAKLVDFGLSGMTRGDGRGVIVGTPDYIAPELLRGAADTHRSDIYSLGATLYHLLSGRPPLEGKTSVDVLKARLFQQPVPLGTYASHVSLTTRKLVMRMLECNPEKRPVNSDAVAADIREARARLNAPPTVTTRIGVSVFLRRFFAHRSLPRRAQPAKKESRRHAYVIGVLCLVAVVAFLFALRDQSYVQTLEWLRRDVAGLMKTWALRVSPSQTRAETAVRVRDVVMDAQAGDLSLKDGVLLSDAVVKGVSCKNVFIIKHSGGVGMYSYSQFVPASAAIVSNLLREVAGRAVASVGPSAGLWRGNPKPARESRDAVEAGE